MVTLSVMDQSPIPSGSTAAQALADTLALAQEADRLGFRRFWLAEHHNTRSLAGTAPEVMTATIAARTSGIRVGSGGVLLTHYSPLKVAEAFRTLEALYPGRIDLGLGRADGADAVAVAALQQDRHAVDEEYPERVADLVGFLDDALAPGHRYADVRAMPDTQGTPEVWVLGSSSYGADLAARMGLPFCFAHFVSPRYGRQVMAGYRRHFRPSPRCPAPCASVGVSVICAATDSEADRLATSGDVWGLRKEGAGRGPLLPPEGAEAYPASEVEKELLVQHHARRFTGAPDKVHAALSDLATEFEVDELVVRTVCHDPAARLRSYRLLAEVFSLPRRS